MDMTRRLVGTEQRLSGGQKQRISIARVFLKNPPLLILDRSYFCFEQRVERAVQSLSELAENKNHAIGHCSSTFDDYGR